MEEKKILFDISRILFNLAIKLELQIKISSF